MQVQCLPRLKEYKSKPHHLRRGPAAEFLAMGFPSGWVIKNPSAQGRRHRFYLWVGRAPGGVNDNPLQYSCLEKSIDRGACQARVHGVPKSQTRLSGGTTCHRENKEQPSPWGDASRRDHWARGQNSWFSILHFSQTSWVLFTYISTAVKSNIQSLWI